MSHYQILKKFHFKCTKNISLQDDIESVCCRQRLKENLLHLPFIESSNRNMEALAGNMSTFVLGVVVPLSTMAAVAIGCGDNRQAANNRKKPGPVKKHGSVSSKKNHSSKSKSGRVISSNKSLKKGKHGSESKKLEKNASTKDASKKPSKDKLKNKKNDPSNTSSVGKAIKPGSIKSASAISATTSGKSASAEVTAKLPSCKPPQSYKQLESSRRSVPVYTAEPMSHIRMEPHQLFYNSFGGVQQVTLHNTGASTERHAIKVKCSDNGLYRVNPVYAFVEPGRSLSLNIYRNASAVSAESRLDKLVFVVAPVSKEEVDPMNAFKDERVNHPSLSFRWLSPVLLLLQPFRHSMKPVVSVSDWKK
uniref:Major sperm protein n=1 Tax=Ditylenchus dipsaci TaxID=166011 RepID=A0A915EJM4_9BILA